MVYCVLPRVLPAEANGQVKPRAREIRGVVKHARMRLLFEISCIKNLEFNQRRRIKTNKGG